MNTNLALPLVTIGVPVYNEGQFLRQSLDALVAQNYKNLELLISDNGSTDDTQSICEEFSSRFNFINYHRFNENRGIAINSSYVLDNASGKYFMWASGHDLWSNNYISECVSLLENTPDALIAFGSSEWIDEQGSNISRQYGWLDTRGLDVFSRYIMTFWGNMHPILGVINRESLTSEPIVNVPGADMIILCRLSLQGYFIHADNAKWSRREIRHELSYQDKLNRYKSEEYGMSKSILDRMLPLARLPIELIKNIFHSKLSVLVKIFLLFLLFAMFPVKYIAGKLSTIAYNR